MMMHVELSRRESFKISAQEILTDDPLQLASAGVSEKLVPKALQQGARDTGKAFFRGPRPHELDKPGQAFLSSRGSLVGWKCQKWP